MIPYLLPSLKGRGWGWVGPRRVQPSPHKPYFFPAAAGTTAIVQSFSGRSHFAAVA